MASPRPCCGVPTPLAAAIASALAFQSMITSPRAGAASNTATKAPVSTVDGVRRASFMGFVLHGVLLRPQAKQDRPAAVTRKAEGNAEIAPKFEAGDGVGYNARPGRQPPPALADTQRQPPTN